MAGIFDDVMDSIAAKEKQEQTTTPQTQTTQTTHGLTPTSIPPEAKPLHTYSDDFNKTYGKGKAE